MRFAAACVTLALLGGCAGCKDKQPAKQTAAGSGSQTGKGPVVPRRKLNAPIVNGPGVEAARPLAARVYYTSAELAIDDETVAELNDGAIEPQKLDYLVHVLEEKARTDEPVGLVLQGSMSYQHVSLLLGALKRAGIRNLAMLTGEGKLIPLAMPDPAELGVLRPVVSLRSGMLSLWSLSGQEGSETAPLFTSPADKGMQPLVAALGQLVQRRWPGTRSPPDLVLTLQLESTATVATLMELVASVRSDASRALFPSVFLMVI